jgi:hypothetical protein
LNRKEIHSKSLKFLLIVGYLLLSDFTVFAQNQAPSQNSITSDTNAVKKQKQGFFGFFTHLFSKKPSTDYVRKKSNSKSDTSAAKKPSKAEPFELTKGSVTWESFYTQGVNLNTGVNGLYSLGRLSQGFDVYGAPLTGQGTGVFNNGQFERSYSSYSMNFDMETYLNGLRERAKNILLNKRAPKKMPNLSDSLNAFESLREKMQSPSCQAEESASKSQFQKDEDSLQKHPGSDTTELHNLRMKLYKYEQLGKRYQQLFAIKKNSGNLEKADSADKKYEQDEKLLNNPDNVEKILEDNHQLSGYEKFLMGVQKFSIGQSGEEISEFTLHSFMMNGVNIGYKSDDIYTYVGYGKEVAVVDPYLMTGINVPEYNRTIEFVRTGEGADNASNFYATIIKITDPGGNNSIDETNWILDLSKQVTIGKNVAFQAELAKSDFSYVPDSYDPATPPFTPDNNNTMAYALRGKATLPGLKTILKAEVSKTGGDFVTLGNPYLISGATKYELDLIQPLGQKLSVGIGATHIIENTMSSDGTMETDNWIQYSILYKPTNQINLEFKYAPSQFQQESGTVYANSTTNNINQISLTGTMASQLFDEKTTTTFFAGNFQCNTGETSQLLTQNLNLSYYMINELLMLSPTQGINVSADESRNNWTGGLSQFIGQSTYNWNLKKSLTVGLGPQWVEQPGVIPNEAGITSSLSGSIKKWGRLGIQCTYRNNIEKPLSSLPQYLISGNLSILW